MARIKLFGVEAEVNHLVWSCPDENVKEILEIFTEANRNILGLPHGAMSDNSAVLLIARDVGAEVVELDPFPEYGWTSRIKY
jgi:hypothetical protein